MTFLVPYDATALADAALERAADLGRLTHTPVEAMTVIPRRDREFATDRDLLEPDETYDYDLLVERFRERVDATASAASFRHVAVGRYAPSGTVANRLRSRARDDDVSVVFVGSENAGRYVSSLSSVGRAVAASTAYDVYVVRQEGSTAAFDTGDHSER